MLLVLGVIFGVVALIALLLGARGIASCTFGIAKILFAIFLVVAIALLIEHFLR